MKSNYPFILMRNILLFFIFFCGVNLSWADYKHQKNQSIEVKDLLNRNLIYRYVEKTFPVKDNKEWEISISDRNDDFYIRLTTTRAPVNCFNKGLPISVLELTPEKPTLIFNKKIKVAIFCGGDYGHHQNIFLIEPFSMKINILDIGNTPINLINNNGKWYVYTYQEYYDKISKLRVPYFLIRQLSISDTNFNIDTTIANDTFSKEKYLELVKKAPKNSIEQYQNMIYLGFSKNRTKFCDLSGSIKDKNLQNLSDFFNFPPCK